MNIVGSWILKHMRYISEKGEIVYDLVNSFYLLVRIIKVQGYSDVYCKGMPGLIKMVSIVEGTLQLYDCELYDHILLEGDENIDLIQYFTKTFFSMFIGNLQKDHPKIAQHIFDVFLFDGRDLIVILLLKFIASSKEKLIKLKEDEEKSNYLKD
jgi:hypothetical protein